MLCVRASKVWDTVKATSEKHKGQSVVKPPLCIFSNVHDAYPVVTQSARAECDVKCHRSSAFSSALRGGVTKVLVPCCPSEGPAALSLHTHGLEPSSGLPPAGDKA